MYSVWLSANIESPPSPPRYPRDFGRAHAYYESYRQFRQFWLHSGATEQPAGVNLNEIPSDHNSGCCVVDITSPDVACFGLTVVRAVMSNTSRLHERPSFRSAPHPLG